MKKLLLASLLFLPSVALCDIHTKTIEYAFVPSTNVVVAETTRLFTTMVASVPETSGRVFKSVYGYYYVMSASATAGSVNNRTLKFTIDSNPTQVRSSSNAYANSGESNSFIWVEDYTSYFNTYFTKSSHTINTSMFVRILQTNNASCKLVITYDYDDAATTRIKTVKIPIQSSTYSLTANMQEIRVDGDNQVPALDTFLPEQSKVYRDIFFEIRVNESQVTAGTDPNLQLGLDSDTPYQDSAHVDDLASSRYYYLTWKSTGMNTATTHAFKAATTNTASMAFSDIGAILVVTYEYDALTSTSVMNSIQVPLDEEYGVTTSTNEDLGHLAFANVTISEPGPIVTRHSGILQYNASNFNSSLNYKGAELLWSTYTYPSTQSCGQRTFIHRLDYNDSGFSLSAGTNTIITKRFAPTNALASNHFVQGSVVYLNYVSGISSSHGGDANHNHTVNYYFPARNNSYYAVTSTENYAPLINQASYYFTGGFFDIVNNSTAAANPLAMNFLIYSTYTTSEFFNSGVHSTDYGVIYSDPEDGIFQNIYGIHSDFIPYTGYPFPDKMDLEKPRAYQVKGTNIGEYTFLPSFTYHTSTFSANGTISNYTGDGSGITVDIYSTLDNKKILTATSVSGGTFSATWFDNNIPIYAVAYQSSTKNGRSPDTLAGNALNIDFGASAGGSSEHSYSFTE